MVVMQLTYTIGTSSRPLDLNWAQWERCYRVFPTNSAFTDNLDYRVF